MKKRGWPEGFDRKPNGVFKVRKSVPKEVREILGRDEFNHTFKDAAGRGLKDELAALDQYPTFWREFNRQIDNARLGFRQVEDFELVRATLSQAIHAKAQSYIVRNDGSDVRGNELKAQLVERLEEDRHLHEEFDQILLAQKITMPADSPIRAKLFKEYRLSKMEILGKANKDWLMTAAMKQLEAIRGIDDSDAQAIARATIKNYDKPSEKPMMRMSEYFKDVEYHSKLTH